MVDWMAIKQAADVISNQGSDIIPLSEIQKVKVSPSNIKHTWELWRRMPLDRIARGYQLPPEGSTDTQVRGGWTPKEVNGVEVERDINGMPARQGEERIGYYKIPYQGLRERFYRNKARGAEETRDVMVKRWAYWYSMANHRQANRLDYLRLKGYIPPVPTLDRSLVWEDFRHPSDTVRITYRPSSNNHDFYDHRYHNILLTGRNDRPMSQFSTLKHELAHAVTNVSDGRQSVVEGIPGGSKGVNAAMKGFNGAYELAPSEFYRHVFLQKALADNMNFRRLSTPEDWVAFNRYLNSYRGLSDKERGDAYAWPEDLSQVPLDRDGSVYYNAGSPDDLFRTYEDIEKRMKDPNPFTRRKAKDEYVQFMEELKRALDTAHINTGNRNGIYV